MLQTDAVDMEVMPVLQNRGLVVATVAGRGKKSKQVRIMAKGAARFMLAVILLC